MDSLRHTRWIRRRLFPLIAIGAVALAVVIAGCGGSASHSANSGGAASHSATSASSGATQQTGKAQSSSIPQNNGGDMDADNNGGPTDGDGNV